MALSDDTDPHTPSNAAAPQAAISQDELRQRLTACEYLGDRFIVAVEQAAVALPHRETLLFRLGRVREISALIESETGALCADLDCPTT